MQHRLNLILVSLLVSSFLGCTRKSENSKVTIQLPNGNISQKTDVTSASGGEVGWNSSLNPTSLADINCYAIFVGGPDPFLNENSCSNSSTSLELMRFGPMKAFIPAGSTVDIDVPSGPRRRIWLVGLKASSLSACSPLLMGEGPDGFNLSEPHIISYVERDLPPGPVVVSLDRVLDSSKKFQECSFARNNNENRSYVDYGMGTEDITIPGSNSYSTEDSVFGLNQKAASGRILNHLPGSSGNVRVEVESYSLSNLAVGDQIMVIISAANHSTLGPDGACGIGNFRGKYQFYHVTAVSPGTTPKYIEVPPNLFIPNLPKDAPYPLMAGPSAPHFCFAQFVKVQQFNNLTLGSNSWVYPLPFDWNVGGGIIAMRIKNNLVFDSDSEFMAHATGFKSFVGMNGQGIGGNLAGPHNSGGRRGNDGAFKGGGGGGHGRSNTNLPFSGGRGGGLTDSAHGGSFAGELPGLNNKMFMGGAGGSTQVLGGSGGGIIYIQAKNILTPASGYAKIRADGEAVGGGSSLDYGSGGGAGGSIYLTTDDINGTAPLSLLAAGGNGLWGGASTNIAGGGGAGGKIHTNFCDNENHTPVLSVVGGSRGAVNSSEISPFLSTNGQDGTIFSEIRGCF